MTAMTTRPTRDAGSAHAPPGPEPLPVAQELVRQRRHVVRRLLAGGISHATLRRILPEWGALIDETAASLER